MGSFASIGTVVSPGVGTAIGAVADIGLSLFGGGKQKRALEEAARAEQEQFGKGIEAGEEFLATSRADIDPQLGGGQSAAQRLQELLTGAGGERRVTRGEEVATQQALKTISNQASAGIGGGLLSGPRLVRAGEAAADIGSRFRQQDIANLLGFSGQGLQAAGLAQGAGRTELASEAGFLRDIGASKSGTILGKDVVTQRQLGDIGSAGGNLLSLLKKKQVQPVAA